MYSNDSAGTACDKLSKPSFPECSPGPYDDIFPDHTVALRRAFSRVYIEEAARQYPRTERILSRVSADTVIPIRDYKNVFNRPNQATALQKQAPALILAVLKPPFLYPGAAVCQDFGERHFYYTSCVMNCPYDCEYCYLQGMYPSGDIVIFVNLEDIFAEITKVLAKHPLYLCISFDTDLPALEGLTGFLKDWAEFARSSPSLLLEVRTKSAAVSAISPLPVLQNMILAITVSPEPLRKRFEHRTPPLIDRLNLARTALSEGRQVRLCFDPMIWTDNYEAVYGELFQTVSETLPVAALRDVSVGTFRISADYLKRMRKNRPCLITAYPYTNRDGVCGYEEQRTESMLRFAVSQLTGMLPAGKIFLSEDLPKGVL